ncbi:hypothetical protein M407DRAFT_199234 [Tulasnella calospora MUT 4182]|uniref:DRBM domain-containing protein n=1 Tax=Tulasnella calospora MUT 4182 TaxID=1051891 RepID=A0A0C3QV34_9AGAM|nr:hypothetical protein M407DRAFT_199234 [Tulasnella calospora MUT 4182]
MADDPRNQYFMQINNKAQSRIISFSHVLANSGPQHLTQWTYQLTVTIPNFEQRVFFGNGTKEIHAKNSASRDALLWLAGHGL